MPKARPFAVFDIDGTLIRWQLYHALADELARQGHLDPIAFEKIRQERMRWKQRGSDNAFLDYERALINLVDIAIVHISVTQLQQACRSVIAEYKDQVYTYTRDLIKQLRQQNYWLFTISASQSDIVEMLARYYMFDNYGGSVYETKDGYYTGQKLLLTRERKPKFLQELVTKHGASWKGSIAVGDSESDIPMLDIVEHPIAFNPTQALFAHAQTQGWKVVIERKNMVYQLEADNGNYRLN